MGKNKLERFSEIGEFDHVYELTDFEEGVDKPGGRWRSEIFGNDHPITLELACGKGEYTLALAERFPGINVIGIDIKGARIWKGAKRALKKDLDNVRFLRIYIDHLDQYFDRNEVDEIWITFPDPYPRYSKRNKRLTAPKFLKIYQRVLKPEGKIHLKTDSRQLYEFSLEKLDETGCHIEQRIEDIYQEDPEDPLLTIRTYYEKKHLEAGKAISYLRFTLPQVPLNNVS